MHGTLEKGADLFTYANDLIFDVKLSYILARGHKLLNELNRDKYLVQCIVLYTTISFYL